MLIERGFGGFKMNKAAIIHESILTDCYAIDEKNLEIKLRTGKDITSVTLVWKDPFRRWVREEGGCYGGLSLMDKKFILQESFIWISRIQPLYKRASYYFEISSENEKIYFCENGFYTEEEFNFSKKDEAHFFKMPWMNSSDIIKIPSWVNKTVWYQIMPDRFCSAGTHFKKYKNKEWSDDDKMSYYDFYGGDLQGIISKLDYLNNLGINGIYLTPVFESDSNHKYNINDYYKIDPDFGTEEDMVELVQKAHSLGIKIMVDAVFNHSGIDFEPWKDILKNEEKSKFCQWFFINKFPVQNNCKDTSDGRYFSFSFENYMPKLNTNFIEVSDYFTKVCTHWVKDWHVDGIRFDVADEISHSFIKRLHRELKSINPELFLLGEIWQKSMNWLNGDEFDSVMNYPLLFAENNFFNNESESADEFCNEINNVYFSYSSSTSENLFNFIDTHDTGRAFSSCKSIDEFYQKLALMFFMPGTSCIFYGTEVALPGGDGPYKRRCMPWKKIENGDFTEIQKNVSALIKLRRSYELCSSLNIKFILQEKESRLIHFIKGNNLEVLINASDLSFETDIIGKELFSYKYENKKLKKGGILVVWKK